ncbi:MAG: hypothetical protein Q8P63_00295 [Candidatus Nealsonbacteria bacterium]|nr:hypothetical protein [Candidatus Nealsonbacteria bacterium]
MTIDIYKKNLLDCFPRIISCCDRNKYSPSFGCFDRSFWHYKIIDTPSVRLQEGSLILTLLYLDSETQFFHKKEIRELINGGLRFWLKIQNREGSFNEWYPYEKSFVATAFSSYAISETLLLLPDIKEKEKVIAGLRKAADWLCGKRDKQALNQNIGALAALYNIFLLTGDSRYQQECDKIIEFLKKEQNQEGWFFEYGSADIGYLSLSLDYLAKYYLKSKNEEVRPLLEKGLLFLSYFIHPDGSVGGIYGSRNTAYFIPCGIEILANFMPLADKMSSVLRESIQNNRIISLKTLDDRYLIQNGYTYLEASRQLKQRDKESENIELPSFSFKDKHFPNAGILIKSTPKFYCIVNYKKGGVFYFYDRSKKISIYNSGLLLRVEKKIYSSCYISGQNEIYFSPDGKTLSIKGRLKEAVDYHPTPFRFVVLRILLGITNFLPYFDALIKSVFRTLLISQKTRSSLYFERSFNIDNDVLIKDMFSPQVFDEGQVGGIQELIYTPSSRYFNNNLSDSNAKPIEKKELAQGEVEYRL